MDNQIFAVSYIHSLAQKLYLIIIYGGIERSRTIRALLLHHPTERSTINSVTADADPGGRWAPKLPKPKVSGCTGPCAQTLLLVKFESRRAQATWPSIPTKRVKILTNRTIPNRKLSRYASRSQVGSDGGIAERAS